MIDPQLQAELRAQFYPDGSDLRKMQLRKLNKSRINISKLSSPSLIITVLITIFWLLGLYSCTSNHPEDELTEYVFVPSDELFDRNKEYIIVLGDIQEYTRITEYEPFLAYSIEWIKQRNEIEHNIVCVLQNGDITNNNTPQQWQTAKDAFNIIRDSILYIWCTGNHDYAWESGIQIFRRESSGINQYGMNSLLNQSIIAAYEKNKIDNIIVKTSLKKHTLNIISLEFGPSPEVVQWAKDYVESHQKEYFILMTHEYLTSEGERVENGTSYAKLQFPTTPYTEPDYLWEHLIRPNNNIICVLCGHNGFCRYLESININGRKVPQILFNLQYQENGGNSLVQIWEFDPQVNEINISVYNTMKQAYYKPNETKFSFSY